jgi:hypothetical protein
MHHFINAAWSRPKPAANSLPPPVQYYPILNGRNAGRPCNCDGNFLLPGALPPPQDCPPLNDFSLFARHEDFDPADLLHWWVQMSMGAIDELTIFAFYKKSFSWTL